MFVSLVFVSLPWLLLVHEQLNGSNSYDTEKVERSFTPVVLHLLAPLTAEGRIVANAFLSHSIQSQRRFAIGACAGSKEGCAMYTEE